MFLGEDIGAWLVLALGAAMAAGHAAALLSPPRRPGRAADPPGGAGSDADDSNTGDRERDRGSDHRRVPLGRSLLFIGIGLVAAIWALASLVS